MRRWAPIANLLAMWSITTLVCKTVKEQFYPSIRLCGAVNRTNHTRDGIQLLCLYSLSVPATCTAHCFNRHKSCRKDCDHGNRHIAACSFRSVLIVVSSAVDCAFSSKWAIPLAKGLMIAAVLQSIYLLLFPEAMLISIEKQSKSIKRVCYTRFTPDGRVH